MRRSMASGLLNSVRERNISVVGGSTLIKIRTEHTLLVTETGVEILTASNADSPGGPVPMPVSTDEAKSTAS